MRIRFVAFTLAVCLAAPLSAQYGPVQDSTLIGLRRVYLNFSTALTDSAVLRDNFTLELRKTGIRLAPRFPADSVDGVMNVLVGRRPSGTCEIRIDLEQAARLLRTNRVHRVVTWFYWDDSNAPCRDSWMRDGLKRAADVFLTKWLDMNGR